MAEGNDTGSGVTSLEASWRVDDGEWQSYTGPFRGEAGRRYEFRSRARDAVGLHSPYVTFATVVRTTSPPPAGPPTPAAARDAGLELRSVRLKRGWLSLRGSLAQDHPARVRVYVKRRGAKRAAVRYATPTAGRWKVRLKLRRGRSKFAIVRVSVPATTAFNPAELARTVRLRPR